MSDGPRATPSEEHGGSSKAFTAGCSRPDAVELTEVAAGSDDELSLVDWLARLMFAPFLDPARAHRETRNYETWLHGQGFRLV